MRQWNCLCCAGPIDKDLICCFLATGIPTQSTSSSPCSPPPPWHAPWDCANPCCVQCLLYAVVTLHRPGVWGAEVGVQHLLSGGSIRQPLSGLSESFIVNLSDHFSSGPAVVLLKRSAGVALPWTWGCMPSVPRFIYGLSPFKMSANLFW